MELRVSDAFFRFQKWEVLHFGLMKLKAVCNNHRENHIPGLTSVHTQYFHIKNNKATMIKM